MNDLSTLFKALDGAMRPLQWDDIAKMFIITAVIIAFSFGFAFVKASLVIASTNTNPKPIQPPEPEPMVWPHLMEIPLDEREFIEKSKNLESDEVIGIGDDGELIYASEKPKNEEVEL